MNHFYELNNNQQMLVVFICTMIISRPLWLLIKFIFTEIFKSIKDTVKDFVIYTVRDNFNSFDFGPKVKNLRWVDKKEGCYTLPDKTLEEYLSFLEERIKSLEEKK